MYSGRTIFVVANIFEGLGDFVNGLVDKTLGNVVRGIFGSIYTSITSAVTKITGKFLAPLGMNLTAFDKIIPAGKVFYKIILWFGFGIATLILLWQLFRTLLLKKDGEHPVRLVARYALTVFIMFASTTLFNVGLNIANVPYNALKEAQYTYDDYLEGQDASVWSLIFGRDDDDYGDELPEHAHSEYDDNLTGDRIGIVSKGEKIISSTFYDNGADIGELEGSLSAFILGLLLSLLFTIFIFINFIKLLVECIERYVVLGILCYTAPLPLAAGVSEETRQIRSSWVRMCISQVLVLFFSMWFIRGFAWAYANAYEEIRNHPKYAVFYLGMVLAFLKIGQHVDEYMGILGMSTAKTGGGLLEDLAMVMPAIRSAGRAVGNAIKGGSDGGKGGRNSTPDAASVYNPIDPRKTPPSVSGKKAEGQFRSYMTGVNPNMQLSDMKVSKGRATATQHFPDGSKRDVSWRRATDEEIKGAMNGTKPRMQNEEWVTAKDGSRHLQTTHAPKAELEAAMKNGTGLSNYSLNGRTENGLDFSHGNLNSVNADASNLQNLNVSNGAVKDTTANGAHLYDMNASHTVFDNFEATNTLMPGLKANDSHIRYSNLSGSQMPEADLTNSTVDHSNLSGANCAGMNASGKGTTLSDNDMTGIVAHHMNGSDGTWTGNNASEGNFDHADLSRLKGRDNSFKDGYMENALCNNWEMEGTNFNGVHGSEITMTNGSLTGKTTMYETDFHDGDLSNNRWHNIKGERANFEGSNLCGTEVYDSVLHDFSFAGCVVDDGTKFIKCDLSGSNFSGMDPVVFAKIDFTDTDLTNCIMPDGRRYDSSRDYGNTTIKNHPKPEKMSKDKDENKEDEAK